MEPHILYEDQDILVINKPSGMTVNTADTTKNETTVQDWAEKKLKIPHFGKAPRGEQSSKLKMNEESDFYKRGGIVHRLDKETSGVLIIAKNPASFTFLQKQFKEREVEKTYLALVHGVVAPEIGEIRVPLGRLPWNRKRFGVVAGGREAVTRFKVESSKLKMNNEQLSLLELYPQTGRTHQLRVHLKHVGHPIFGDFLYAGRKTARSDRKMLGRVFLHASKITFTHPATHAQVSFEAPLPSELRSLIKRFSG